MSLTQALSTGLKTYRQASDLIDRHKTWRLPSTLTLALNRKCEISGCQKAGIPNMFAIAIFDRSTYQCRWPVSNTPTASNPPGAPTVDFNALGAPDQSFTIPNVACDITYSPNCNPAGVTTQFAARFTGNLIFTLGNAEAFYQLHTLE